jgi:hypothetical protein
MKKDRRRVDHSLDFHSYPTQISFESTSPSSNNTRHVGKQRPLDLASSVQGREASNKFLQHPYFKNLCKIAQASKNSESNAQHFLSDLLTHSRFHSMLFALPGYQFPYTVMTRCLYLKWHS